MTPVDLEKYLRGQIPLAQAMQISVVELGDDAVVLSAPLAPNINPHATVFGGSASAVAILAAWSLVDCRLRNSGVANHLVIQKSTMEYLLPVAGEFSARSSLADPAQWPQFLRMLSRKGKARISVSAELEYNGLVAGRFSGEFVAMVADAH